MKKLIKDPINDIRKALVKSLSERAQQEPQEIPNADCSQIIDRTIDHLPDSFRQQLLGTQVSPLENWNGNVWQELIAERHAQFSREGYSDEHDDQHKTGELIKAACCYAEMALSEDYDKYPPENWPWEQEAWKPKSIKQDLVRAAALLIAEIERLERAERGEAQ